MFKFIAMIALFCSSQAFATGECRQAFVGEVKECVQGLQQLRPKLRPRALVACVKAAKAELIECRTEPPVNVCAQTCQATYDTNVTTCGQAYDPAVCGGDQGCIDSYVQARADCVSQSAFALNSCTAACPQ
jgi:hypothetical protein